jgi:hypothetical protein
MKGVTSLPSQIIPLKGEVSHRNLFSMKTACSPRKRYVDCHRTTTLAMTIKWREHPASPRLLAMARIWRGAEKIAVRRVAVRRVAVRRVAVRRTRTATLAMTGVFGFAEEIAVRRTRPAP